MAYQALARKWRPRTFQDVVGQASTLRILTHALEKNRLHHAYLFTGTRGVGKTTLARILVKCLNCEQGITSNPCGACSHCQAIDAGKFLDLYEIDAASRTKVEDTRDLLENVSYPPVAGRYKVYLIDEVHMLSQHSFNALLKTLEEPPEHVKFLLATTDPKRLPVTILSRCLQFQLKHILPDVISARLQTILTQENIAHDDQALLLLAKAAKGSMRDALSLLDQAIAFGAGNVNEADVKDMLGSVSQRELIPLLNALISKDGTSLFTSLKQLLDIIGDAHSLLEETISILHAAAMTQMIPNNHDPLDICHDLAKKLAPETLQLYYQIAILGRRDLHLASTPQQGIEMVFLRMLAFTLQQSTKEEAKPITPSFVSDPLNTHTNEPLSRTTAAPLKEPLTTETENATSVSQSPKPIANTVIKGLPNWHQVLEKLGLTGMAYMIATNCILDNHSDNKIHLILAKQHAPILTEKLRERIETALSQHFSTAISLSITIGDAALATPAKKIEQEKKMQQQEVTERISRNPVIKHFLDHYDTTLDITVLSS